MNWLFKFRMASLLASAAIRLAKEDPAGFTSKAAERIRTSDNKLLSKLPVDSLNRLSLPASQARSLINLGYLSEGIALIDKQGSGASRSDRHLAARTRERLEQLTQAPPASVKKLRNNGKHRVLHYLTNSVPYTHSGYTMRTHNVLKAQKSAGLEVRGVTRLAYPVLVGKVPPSGVQVIDGIEYHRLLPTAYPVSLLERDRLAVDMLVEQAKRFGATILHTTTDFKNAVVVSKAAEHLGIPWVYEIRGELESTWLSKQPDQLQEQAASSQFYRLARNQETSYARSADAVVTLSEIVKRQFGERGVTPEKIHVIPNAIDAQVVGRKFDRDEIRKRFGLPSTPLIGTVTSVVGYEGIDILIRALHELPNSIEALIVGDGTARPELEKLARKLGLRSRVHFVGRKPQAEIWQWYAALDIFVVPRKDTRVCRVVTPIKALMAQALGIPVVASDLPALREVTGNTAYYVRPEEPKSLAYEISHILAETKLRQPEKTWVQSRTWQANAEKYLDLYRQI